MPRARLIVFTAVALLIAETQCALACAANPCGTDSVSSESVPPCHLHHDHSHDRVPDSCPHQTILAPAISSQALHVEIPLSPVMALSPAVQAAPPADSLSLELALSASSPPGLSSLSSVVLRI
jgi:hypothetical protein